MTSLAVASWKFILLGKIISKNIRSIIKFFTLFPFILAFCKALGELKRNQNHLLWFFVFFFPSGKYSDFQIPSCELTMVRFYLQNSVFKDNMLHLGRVGGTKRINTFST